MRSGAPAPTRLAAGLFALLAAGFLLVPERAEAQTVMPIWEATLTVGIASGSASRIGWSNHSGNQGSLSDTSIEWQGRTVEIEWLYRNSSGTGSLTFQQAASTGPEDSTTRFKLCAGSAAWDLGVLFTNNNSSRTTDTASGVPDWSIGDMIDLAIVLSTEACPSTTTSGLGQVTGLTATAAANSLDLSWTAVTGAGGYKVQWKSGAQSYNETDRQATVGSGATTTHTISNLTAGTTYTVRVAATKSGETDGAWSTETTGTPTAPATPEISIAAGTSPVTEGTAASFTVNATSQPASNLTVNLTVAQDTTDGADHVASGNLGTKTVTIMAGQSSATYTVATVADAVDEPNGSVTVTVETGSDYTVAVSPSNSASVTVNDNDAGRSLTVGPAMGQTVDEDAGTVNTTVTASGLTAFKFRCWADLADTNTTAAAGDFSGLATTFANASGAAFDFKSSAEHTVSLTVTDDAVDEPNEALRIRCKLDSDQGGTAFGTLTITDDDTAGVTVDPTTLTVTEGGAAGSYGVVLTSQPTGTVTVTPSSSDTGAATVSPNSLSFTTSTWSTEQTVTVSPVNDTDANGENVTVSNAVSSGYSNYDTNTAVAVTASGVSVTVNDNDAPIWTATLTVAVHSDGTTLGFENPLGSAGGFPHFGVLTGDTLSHGGATVRLTKLVRPTNGAGNLEVAATTVSGTGVAGTFKLCIGSGSVTWANPFQAAGLSSVAVPGVAAWSEGDAVSLALVGSSANCPTAMPDAAFGEVAGLTVTPGNGTLVVSWNAVSGADDYMIGWTSDSTPGHLPQVWKPHQRSNTRSDTSLTLGLDVGTEYRVRVAARKSGQRGPWYVETGTPIGAPAKPSQPTFGTATQTSLEVNWTAPAANGRTITHYDLRYKLSTASTWSDGPQDQSGLSATISSLTAGTQYDVQVRAANSVGDGPWSDTNSGSTAAAGAPEISIAATSGMTTVQEGATTSFTVSASPAPPLGLTVTLSVVVTDNGASTTITPNPTVTIGSGASSTTWTRTTQDDGTDEEDGSVAVTVQASSDGSYGVSSTANSATVTVTDNDATPQATLQVSPASIPENGGQATVTATLNRPSSQATELLVQASPVAPATAAHFTVSTNTTLTIAAGQTTSTGTVRISATDNNVDDANRQVTVSALAQNSLGVTAPADRTLTIVDNEGSSAVTLQVSPTSISENGGSATVTGRLTSSSSQESTVTVTASAVAAGAAVARVSPPLAGDFALVGTTLTFASGSTTSTGTVTITALDNDVVAPNKQVTIAGTSSAGFPVTGATLVIVDDDGDPGPGGGGGPPPPEEEEDEDDDTDAGPPPPPPPSGPPEAAFTLSAECGGDLCRARTGAAVRFKDTSTGIVRSRLWDFGDGRTSRARSVEHSWAAPGFYEVTLWTSDGTVESTASSTFLVEAAAPAGTCVADGRTRCLRQGRFAVTVDWWTADGSGGSAAVVPAGTDDSGLFQFFNPNNWEVLIKVLDGCPINGHPWVFAASTTNLGYLIRVEDTATGAVKEYGNQPGMPASAITDTTAFHGCAP